MLLDKIFERDIDVVSDIWDEELILLDRLDKIFELEETLVV